MQQIMGSLQWVSLCTRPDISTAVALLSQYQNSPSPGHLKVAKHIVKYLKGTASISTAHRTMSYAASSNFRRDINNPSQASLMQTGAHRTNPLLSQHHNNLKPLNSTNLVLSLATLYPSMGRFTGHPNNNPSPPDPPLNRRFMQQMSVARISCSSHN